MHATRIYYTSSKYKAGTRNSTNNCRRRQLALVPSLFPEGVCMRISLRYLILRTYYGTSADARK